MPTASQCLILMNEEGVDTNLSKRRYSGANSNVSMPNLFLTSEKEEEPRELPRLFDISAGPNHRPYELVVNGYQGTMSYDTKEHSFKWQIHSKDAMSSNRPKRKVSYTMASYTSYKKSEKYENSLSLSTSTSIMKMMDCSRSQDDLHQKPVEDKSSSEYLENLGFRKGQPRVKSAFRKVEASSNMKITGISKDINFLPTPPGAPPIAAPDDKQLMAQTDTTTAHMPKVLATTQDPACTCSRSTTPRKPLDYTTVQISTPWKAPLQNSTGNITTPAQNEQVPAAGVMEREFVRKLAENEPTNRPIVPEYVQANMENEQLFRPIHYEYVKKITEDDFYSQFEHENVRKNTENAKQHAPKYKTRGRVANEFVPIFIPTEHSYIQSSTTDVTDSQSSQESVENSFTISVDIQLKPSKASNVQKQNDIDCKGCVFPVTHKMKKLPEPDPTAVCFTINGDMSHQDVISLVKLQTGYDVKSIQYDPVFIRAKCGKKSRWIVKLESSDVCKTVIKSGLEWKGYKICVKSLDDVYLSEYTRYHKKQGAKDDHALKQKTSRKNMKTKRSKTKAIQN